MAAGRKPASSLAPFLFLDTSARLGLQPKDLAPPSAGCRDAFTMRGNNGLEGEFEMPVPIRRNGKGGCPAKNAARSEKRPTTPIIARHGNGKPSLLDRNGIAPCRSASKNLQWIFDHLQPVPEAWLDGKAKGLGSKTLITKSEPADQEKAPAEKSKNSHVGDIAFCSDGG